MDLIDIIKPLSTCLLAGLSINLCNIELFFQREFPLRKTFRSAENQTWGCWVRYALLPALSFQSLGSSADHKTMGAFSDDIRKFSSYLIGTFIHLWHWGTEKCWKNFFHDVTWFTLLPQNENDTVEVNWWIWISIIGKIAPLLDEGD